MTANGSRQRPAATRGLPRGWVRWAALSGAVALAWLGRGESSLSVVLPALSPFVAVCAALATHSVTAITVLALPLLLLALWQPRGFCRYGCPAGLLQAMVERLRPRTRLRPARIPRLGHALVAAAVAGAAFGYPLFLWLDPLALFNAFLSAWRQPTSLAAWIAGLGLPLLLLTGLLFPRLWCQRLCPLGATQEWLAWAGRPLKRTARRAPAGARTRRVVLLPRRLFLSGCAGAAGALMLRRHSASASPPLRPPGALAEGNFTGVCIRCGNCARICPGRIIQPDFGASGIVGWLTPRLQFIESYCREDCVRCGQVCPSGAILSLNLTEKRRRSIGLAQVDPTVCLLANGRECTACLKHCPYHALEMHSPDGGFSSEPRVLGANCNGCGACEAVCPVRPQRAIRVLPTVTRVERSPA